MYTACTRMYRATTKKMFQVNIICGEEINEIIQIVQLKPEKAKNERKKIKTKNKSTNSVNKTTGPKMASLKANHEIWT